MYTGSDVCGKEGGKHESYKCVSFLLQVVKQVVFFFFGGVGGGGGGVGVGEDLF